MAGEEILRFAAPALYRRMMETFSVCHIHPYDVQTALFKNDDGYDVTIRFASDYSQTLTTHFSFEQADHPDKEVSCFFEEAAEKCKSVLIADYYKMMKL